MANEEQKMNEDEMEERLDQLSESWFIDEDDMTLFGQFAFKDFPEALQFVNDVGAIAERRKHHPEIHISFNEVIIETWTHDVEAVTAKDFELAEEIDGLAASGQ
ncbi:MAG: 4a-hydroxytetrahydrobiopterin dehydratase [Patescibacteria group bacterium]|jgi:4a-hydroxytetrahydrobiopterin dehydratase